MSTAGFLREAARLRRLVCLEERRNDKHESFCCFRETQNELKSNFSRDLMETRQQLENISISLGRLQEQLTGVKPSPAVVERLGRTVTDVESSIMSLKEAQQLEFEELIREEQMLLKEVCVFEKKMEAWSVAVKAEVPDKPVAHPRDCDTLPPQVSAVQNFLQQTGGRNGGWDKFDHEGFVRVWMKHGGRSSYRQEVLLYLPGKTEEDVQRHEEWYLQLLQLQEEKREAIRRWRLARESEREREREHQPVEDEADDEAAAAQLLEQQQQQQRRETSERLEAWRSSKKQQLEDEQEQQLKQQVQQRRRAEGERRRQLEVKLRVQEHLQLKREEAELQILQLEAEQEAEREERLKRAAEGIRRCQERDSRRVELKLQQSRRTEEQRSERERTRARIKQKVEVHVSRDPSRLLRATEGWASHLNAGKAVEPAGPTPPLQMFHRAVPAWRRDL